MIIVQPGNFRTGIESSQLACSVLGHHRRMQISQDVNRLMIYDDQLQVHAWILTLAFRGSLLRMGFRIRVNAGAAVVLLRPSCLSLSIR